MGISGLLPLLKSIQKPCNLKKFSGQTIGVDAYGWLHRGVVSCAVDLALDKPTKKHIDFCMNRVRMLMHFGIKPYLVFDGDNLPGKAGTNAERAAKRKESKKQGMELLKVGKTAKAHLELQKAVDVTPEMAKIFIEELKQLQVDYVVAPYEADSQLVYLERQGLIHGILSEDSDLLVFGAKTLITKLDQYGECIAINRGDFTACREISLVGWSDAEFRKMAILSGCDYLPSINKMGLKTAYRLMRKYKSVERLLRAVQFDGQFKVPAGYLEAFKQAEMTFLHQWVFCPISNQLVNFMPLEPSIDLEELPFIGNNVDPVIARGVATGDLHPGTKQAMALQQPARAFFRPLAPSSRKEAVLATPDPKKPKSIASFFKPKRIPLAELDPNIFTPSPTQEQLLRQQEQESLSATPVPSSSLLDRSDNFSLSVPQPARRTVSEPMTRLTASHPAKRQRLCSDNAMSAANDGTARIETGSSRFFSAPYNDASPSVRDAWPGKKARKGVIDFWSDDSLEEELVKLPDPSQTSSSSKKAAFSVFQESKSSDMTRTSSTASSVTETSQRMSRSTTQTSQNTAGTITTATSCDSQGASSASQPSFFERCLSSEIQQLRSRFSYDSTTAPGKSLSRKKSAPEVKKSQLAKSPVQVMASPTKRRRQSEDAEELAYSSLLTPRPEQVSAAALSAAVQDSHSDFGDDEWAAMEAKVIVPGSDIDAHDDSGMDGVKKSFRVSESPAKAKGSEDLLVPDSEAESEGEISDEGGLTQKIDLSRFAMVMG